MLSGKPLEKAFPRGGVAKKKKSESSTDPSTKKFKENDDLFSTKKEFAKQVKKPISSDSTKSKKKVKKGEKETDEDDILTVKQVTILHNSLKSSEMFFIQIENLFLHFVWSCFQAKYAQHFNHL